MIEGYGHLVLVSWSVTEDGFRHCLQIKLYNASTSQPYINEMSLVAINVIKLPVPTVIFSMFQTNPWITV